jgi:hypothetical protein
MYQKQFGYVAKLWDTEIAGKGCLLSLAPFNTDAWKIS